MENFAAIITQEIDLKAKARLDRATYASKLQEFDLQVTEFIDHVDRNASKESFLQAVKGLCNELGLSKAK